MADPTASAKLATALQEEARRRDMTGARIAEKIHELGGDVAAQSRLWVSRRLTGRKTLIDVDPDLFLIARALEISREELIDLVVRAVFGDPVDQPIPYVLTDKQPPVNADDMRTANEGGSGYAAHLVHFGKGRLSADCPYCTAAED